MILPLLLASAAAPAPAHAAPLAAPLAASLVRSAPLRAEDPAPTDEVKRATEWPEVANLAALKRSISKVRKARTEEMASSGAAELEAIGAAAAPLLLDRMGAEKDAGARERMAAVLDAVTAAEHTRLLAEVLGSPQNATRQYAARRIAQLGDPGLRGAADENLEAWEERAADSRMRKAVDPLDLQRAAILCVATGSTRGLDGCVTLAAGSPWAAFGPALAAACAPGRAAGPEVGAALAARLSEAEGPADRVTLLRLLTFAGSKAQVGPIGPLLDAEQNHVKVAAINALRMIVDGDPPLRRLSSFDAIERANRWKARL